MRDLRWAVGAALLVGLAACGQPTAQLVRPIDTGFTYEIPAEFGELDQPLGVEGRQQYGPPGAVIEESPSEPLLSMTSLGSGDQASFQGLRLLATAGQFDPLDETAENLPAGMQVLGYSEISEPGAWGIRLQFLMGSNVADFQALVDRRTNRIAVTEMFCTQACFVEQQALIDEIQRSWRLEP